MDLCWRREKQDRQEDNIPAVVQLLSDILQVVVAHVIDAEDEAVLVVGDGFPDVLEELLLLLAVLLGDLGEVEHLRALGLGHLDGICVVVWWWWCCCCC